MAVFLLIGFFGLSSSHAQEVENLLNNGGFEDGTNTEWNGPWTGPTAEVVTQCVGAAVPEDPIEGIYCWYVTVPDATANWWDAAFNRNVGVFEKGKYYTLSVWLKSKSGTAQINLKHEHGADQYEGYGEQVFTITEEWAEYSVTTPVFAEDVTPASLTFHIGFAKAEFWIDGARWYEGDYVEPSFKPNLNARSPIPDDGLDNVARDVILSWEPGPFAATHDVYLGKTFEDVNGASRDNPMDVLVSQNQIPTTHQSLDPLEFGQTYYWRIDEVNAPTDSTIFKGDVWSFTVEDYLFPVSNVTATASSSFISSMGPGKTVDGSGLDASDLHSTEPTDMWLSEAFNPDPTWIQFEFGQAHPLVQMQVWNSNQLIESVIGVGIKDVTIEYSEDGDTWTTLGDVEFAQAPGLAAYAADTVVNMGGALAQYVRLTAISNWSWEGWLKQFGLSEVRFFFIPVQASDPQPASGASDVPLDVTLDWRAGRQAVSHEVYLSTDRTAVVDGTALVGTTSDTYFPISNLDYGQVYYWKINEVNDTATTTSWEGEVWNFSTTESMVVEDFESYSTEKPIWESWLDGLGFGAAGSPGFNPGNGTGASVGDESTPSFTEETIVHGGNQSMPLAYDNNKQGYSNYSEAQHTFDAARNWTDGGITQLSLWFRGHPGSVGSFVEEPAGTYTMTGSGTDITSTFDEFHFAYKMLNGAGSIVAKVDSVQNTNDWAKAGVMIRETLDPDSAHAMAFVTPTQGVVFEYRPDTGGDNVGTAGQQTGVTAPYWVKIDRTISGLFTASHSTNGTTWQTLGTPLNIQMSTNVYVGLALTSHDAALTCQAVFSNVTTSASVSGQWAHQDIGIASNDPEPVYVALADSSGALGVVAYEDPDATQISTWTEWSIDLTEFSDQGVNLADIKKMMLGVGDPTAPVAGGSGKMYFDDITVGNPVPAREIENLLVNGGFEDGVLEPWYIADNTGGGATAVVVGDDPVEGNSCLHVVVPTVGANFWDVHVVQPGFIFKAGKKYTLSAWFKCKEGTLDVNIKPEHAADPWEGYNERVITMTDQWAEYSVTTPVFAVDTSPGSTTFHVGFAAGEFWMDDVKFYEGDPPPPTDAVVVGDFEGGLDGWWAADATLSFSTTGATLNTQALQVDGPGDWHQNAKLDLKPHRVALGQPGATITADVTAFDADMTTTWMNVEMVINGQNNDDNGANNNIGWQSLGSHDVTRNGQPQTLTWVLPEALTTAISGVDGNISWFELVLVSNLDGASVTKFYVDNILLVIDAP